MLKKRIIPILLFDNNLLIKTKNFNNDRIVGNIIQSIKVFNKRDTDELCIIDLNSSRNRNQIDLFLLKELISECNMPVSYGGGIKDVQEIQKLLKIGIDKVIINNSFLKNKNFIHDVSNEFGSQSIIAAIDIISDNNKLKIFSKEKPNKLNVIEWLKEIQKERIGELLITSVNHEGTMKGYDFNMLDNIYKYLEKPTLFNGGASSIEDFKKLFTYKNIMAGCASSIFLFTEITPSLVKKSLIKDFPIRN